MRVYHPVDLFGRATLFLIANGVQDKLEVGTRISIGVAHGHGWNTKIHTLVQHANIMVERVIRRGLDLEFFARTAND